MPSSWSLELLLELLFWRSKCKLPLLPLIDQCYLPSFNPKHPNFISTLLPVTWYSCISTSVRSLTMSSDTPAVAALILVPIAIAGSAAYVALKTSHLYKRVSRAFGSLWNHKGPSIRIHRQVHKLRRCDLSSSQTPSQFHSPGLLAANRALVPPANL